MLSHKKVDRPNKADNTRDWSRMQNHVTIPHLRPNAARSAEPKASLHGIGPKHPSITQGSPRQIRAGIGIPVFGTFSSGQQHACRLEPAGSRGGSVDGTGRRCDVGWVLGML